MCSNWSDHMKQWEAELNLTCSYFPPQLPEYLSTCSPPGAVMSLSSSGSCWRCSLSLWEWNASRQQTLTCVTAASSFRCRVGKRPQQREREGLLCRHGNLRVSGVCVLWTHCVITHDTHSRIFLRMWSCGQNQSQGRVLSVWLTVQNFLLWVFFYTRPD